MDVDRGAVSTRIEQLPWVKSAAVAVSWPDGVRITITEETPLVAVPEAGGHWATVSADGRVLQVTTAQPAGLRSLSVPQYPVRRARSSRLGTTWASWWQRPFHPRSRRR